MEVHRSRADFYTFRLAPKSDLRKSILEFAKNHNVKAGCIVTCVGSLEQLSVRFANLETGETKKGFFEIVSLTGTFSESACHLHISIADGNGHTIGGHLLDNSIVYTTAEIVVAEIKDVEFNRVLDQIYGFHELAIRSKD